MKLISLKEFNGSEDGLHTRIYKKNEVIETENKQFADLIINGGYAKVHELETKVVEPEETKIKKKKEK